MDKKVVQRWAPLMFTLLLVGVIWVSDLISVPNLDALKVHREHLLKMVHTHPVLSAAGFIGLYAVTAALSLPVATLLTLLGGFLFGRWFGTLVIVIGATTGATVIFLIARSALGASLRDRAGPLYHRVAANMGANAVSYMLFMRLVPLFPFFGVNVVPALFNVRLAPYVLTTFFGIIPGTFVYANAGRALGTLDSLNGLASPETLTALTLLGLLALLPTIYRWLNGRRNAMILLFSYSLAISQPALAGDNYDRFLALYDGLLKAHIQPVVKDGIAYNGVDYDGWVADRRHQEALKLLLAEDPALYSGDRRKAFWINAYNFLTVDLIVREGERQTIKNIGGLFTSPWTHYSWTLAGKNYTLDYIEHKVLRPLGDPRIHFAINCASVSCPDLRPEGYKAQRLDQQLNDQVQLTLANSGKGLRRRGNVIYVSKIFDWFSEDFEGGNVKDWLLQHKTVALPFTLKFMDYDWSLNKVN